MREAERFRRSAGYAWRGLSYAWSTQPNLRLEASLAVLALALASWLGTGFMAVTLVSVLVLALELINTAIEALVDLLSPRSHPLAGAAKDLSAGAVLVASLGALLVGVVALGPALLERLALL